MENNPLKGPGELQDNIIYTKELDVPTLNENLITFLKNQVSHEFPDIVNTSREDLLKHQGKLELIASLEYLVNNIDE